VHDKAKQESARLHESTTCVVLEQAGSTSLRKKCNGTPGSYSQLNMRLITVNRLATYEADIFCAAVVF
jgi:hypothetical protein